MPVTVPYSVCSARFPVQGKAQTNVQVLSPGVPKHQNTTHLPKTNTIIPKQSNIPKPIQLIHNTIQKPKHLNKSHAAIPNTIQNAKHFPTQHQNPKAQNKIRSTALTPHLTSYTPPTLSPHFSNHLRIQPFKPTLHKAPPNSFTVHLPSVKNLIHINILKGHPYTHESSDCNYQFPTCRPLCLWSN